MQKTIAYFRVSSKAQQKKQSIELQKIRLSKFAKEKGYEIVAEFQDDGISGESIDKRPGFQQALDKIADGKVDVLLVFMINRIGRFSSRRDRNQVIELLEQSKTNVDSPYYRLCRYDSEKDLNDLEGALNDSRAENVEKGIFVREGQTMNRMKGRLAGGTTPYGIFRDKEKGFIIGTRELETVKEIFTRIQGGWGVQKVTDHLNAYPDKFPKRFRRYKGKWIKEWSPENVRYIIMNDFYHSGIVEPVLANKQKGVLAVDTLLKDQLFDRKMIETVRREMSVRRSRKSSQKDKINFSDALLHGIARCDICGWKLGLWTLRQKNTNKEYQYYLCRGKIKHKCLFKYLPVKKLDKIVWKKFIEVLEDPAKMQESILAEDFLIDKDRKSKEVLLKKTEKDLEKYARVRRKIIKLFTWGNITDVEFQEELKGITSLQEQAEEDSIRYRESLARPKEVKYSVKRATELVAEQIEVLSTLNKLKELWADVKSIPRGENILTQLRAADTKSKLYDGLLDILDDLKERSTVTSDDLSDEGIRELIFAQKRAILQQYIDFGEGKGIRVKGFDDIKFNFSLDSL